MKRGGNGMYREYLSDYLKKNRSSCLTVMIAAYIAALFLTLITGIFYNIWKDDINKIISSEGDWHVRIEGSLTDNEITKINNYESISKVEIKSSQKHEVTYLYFSNIRDVYADMPDIAELIHVDMSDVEYHEELLNDYFVFNPDANERPTVLIFYVIVMIIVCISLVLIIRNAFLVTLDSRIQQLGILQSVGATPGQLKKLLLGEAAILSIIPVCIGIASGTGICALLVLYSGNLTQQIAGYSPEFCFSPMIILVSLITSLGTVLYSAWGPTRRLSKCKPIELLNGKQQHIRKMKKTRIMRMVFGEEGELASKSLYMRRRSIRTASLALTLAIMGYCMYVCLMALSGLSTKYTYFDRYKDSWDIMAQIDNTTIDDIPFTDIRSVKDVNSCTVYQLAEGHTLLPTESLSDELEQNGRLSRIAGNKISFNNGQYKVNAPIVIMDDKSFDTYCERIGITDLNRDGCIVLNKIWDSKNSNFRNKEYIPFINKEVRELSIADFASESDDTTFRVLGCTDKEPVLKEEYDNYALVIVISDNYWNKVNSGKQQARTFINIRTENDEVITYVQDEVKSILEGSKYTITNRIEDRENNDRIQKIYDTIMGGVCILLAIIGLANVFSNTLGIMNTRKREFARYMSVGVTSSGIRKILICEALLTGLRPVLLTIPLCILFVYVAAKASYLDISESFGAVPIGRLTVFITTILLCIALAYYLGARRLYRESVISLLKGEIN